MKNIFSITTIILILLLINSCTKDAMDIKLPETQSKLVVGCFISPQDTFITVTVSKSNPVFGNQHYNDPYGGTIGVNDALITISDGTASSTIPYNFNKDQYSLLSSAFPIIGGKTYFLTVKSASGEIVSATCTVPSNNLITATITSGVISSQNGSSNQKLITQFQDFAGQKNYYKTYLEFVAVDTISHDTSYYNGNNTYNYDNNSVNESIADDNNKDGQTLSLYNDVDRYYYHDDYYSPILIGYDIYLMTIDINYYTYQNSLNNYTPDDPFSEPSPIYTNIQGGLGIFCAYQQLRIRKSIN